MAEKLTAFFYLSATDLRMQLIDLKHQMIFESLTSAPFTTIADYQNELPKIISTIKAGQQLMADYGVSDYNFWWNYQKINLIEATYICDQIKTKTGLCVELLDLQQVAYLQATAALNLLQHTNQITTPTVFLMGLESQSITLAKFVQRELVRTWRVDISREELEAIIDSMSNSAINPLEVILDYLQTKLEYLRVELISQTSASLLIQGADTLNQTFLQADEQLKQITFDKLQTCYQDVTGEPNQYLIDKYHITDGYVNYFFFGVVLIHQIFQYIQPAQLFVTRDGLTEGLMLEQSKQQGLIKSNYEQIIMTVVINMAERYHTNLDHASQVAKFATHLFRQLKKLHRLPARDELLLQIACYTSDIGNFISASHHYDHSAYILEANPIIGLSNEENQIITEMSRYHSSKSPAAQQYHYRHLDNDIQLTIAKLVAIIRLADALDDSHQQKIDNISVSLQDMQLIITVKSNQDLTLEQWSFEHKAKFFQEVYGIQAILKQQRSK